MNTLRELKSFTSGLEPQQVTMPLLFIGHGSPMNGIENNEFSTFWENLPTNIPVPKAVLVISAHWLSQGTRITSMPDPRTIHDFYGFPQELYQVNYPAPGHPELAAATISLVKKVQIEPDHEWGLDHGTWTIVRRMYPKAEIPVLQLSIDYSKDAHYHFELARELEQLRKRGVLIIGSGNMIHNLRTLNWQSPDSGYDWAVELNETFKKLILAGENEKLIDYQRLGSSARLAIPTPEHYLPMLYILGLKDEGEPVQIFNDKTVMGSVSMTSFKVG